MAEDISEEEKERLARGRELFNKKCDFVLSVANLKSATGRRQGGSGFCRPLQCRKIQFD